MLRILNTRIKTFRFKVCRTKTLADGKQTYAYEDNTDIDRTINEWLWKNKAIVKHIDINQIDMGGNKNYNTIDIIYTIQYTKG